MTSPYRNRLPMAYLPASRAVDTVGLHPMFRGRVSGVGGILDTINPPADLGNIGTIVRQKDVTPLPGPKTLSDDLISQMFKTTGGGPVTQKVLTPEEIAQQEEIIAKNRAAREAEEKKVQDIIAAAKKWQTTSPIATVKVVRTDGSVVSFDVYGYNKENGQVWLKDPTTGQIGLGHESVFKDSPEWQAAKANLGKSSGSALPLLLGAAYLLLS